MREEYLGSESDQRYVRAYLTNIRALDLKFFTQQVSLQGPVLQSNLRQIA